MSREKTDRNKKIALAYYKGFSIRELGRKYNRGIATIHVLVKRLRGTWTPEELRNAETNRLRLSALRHEQEEQRRRR